MSRRFFVCVVLLSLVAPSAHGQRVKEPLVEQVKKSIDRAVTFLRTTQRPNGSWEVVDVKLVEFQGGVSALAVLALLNAGIPPDDPTVKRGLDYLRGLEPEKVYVRALQTMVLAEAKQIEDRDRIARNVKWLIEARIVRDGALKGWSYTRAGGATTDNSNTQYALLGLWAGKQAGATIPRDVWAEIRKFYLDTQHKEDGSWSYAPGSVFDRRGASVTMSTAGLSGLMIAGMELNVGREVLDRDGGGKNCGVYDDTAATTRAMAFIANTFTFDVPGRPYYHLYGLERLGRLTGERFIGKHDWYRAGCLNLMPKQRDNGSFAADAGLDHWPVVSTSFALLFLSKGRTPILVSKAVHGKRDGFGPFAPPIDNDWNNDRNDLRHLVEFSSKELFKELPLGWQTFDMLHAGRAKNDRLVLTDDDINDIVAEMLQAPILYITGHQSPQFRFSGVEKKILARFVENGGFIFAEACCGSKEFDAGFKALVKEADLWPDNDLSELDSKHPVWKSHFLIKPGDPREPYQLYGISRGCKTILIYSPQDMSCFWENNLITEDRTGRTQLAFRLGANIVAYATGKEPPKPRLSDVDITRGKDEKKFARGFLKPLQIKHDGDYKPARAAMHNLMDYVHRQAGIRVIRVPEEAALDEPSVTNFKFIYMQGRNRFSFPDAEELSHLRFNLENGGLMLADASCGREEFDKAFRAFVAVLFPGKTLERVPPDDVLFSKKVSGVDLGPANVKIRVKAFDEPQAIAPYLEGIKVGGRWALLYSKYDLGCALERHSAADCLGYTPDSAFRVAAAAVLYTFYLDEKK